MARTATLRPGLLVALKTSCQGGVKYERTDLEKDRVTAEGVQRAKWETTRTIDDPEEYEKAGKVRGKVRSLITAVCSPSSFGLLCPVNKEAELNSAIAEAQKVAEEFNAGAGRTQVNLFVLKGRIAADDAEAMRAINSEVKELLDRMEKGIAEVNVEEIRSAANEARRLSAVLTDTAQTKVNAAIDQAREAARLIVKKLVKGGEVATTVMQEVKLDAIQTARFDFLDLDVPTGATETLPVEAPVLDMEQAVAGNSVRGPASPSLEV